MQKVGFLVEMRIPDNMAPEQALVELKASLDFGSPQVRLHYILPDENKA